MTLQEIKDAVEAGKTVHWASGAYNVVKDKIGQWLIVCPSTGGCLGLTRADGVTMNGRPEQFFVKPELKSKTYSLCEAVADIAYIAGEQKYYGGDSRADIAEFISWAQEFEYENRRVEWGKDADYIEAIQKFAETKLNTKPKET